MKKIFDARQEKAIELIAHGGRNFQEIATESGVSVETLRDWRKDPEFQVKVKERCRELLKEAEPFLYRAALKAVEKNLSAQHIKLLMDRLERLEDIAEGRGQEYDVMFTWKKNEQ